MKWAGLPSLTAGASRFSQPHGAFIRPEPAGLVSCQIRSWGSPSRALLLSHSRSPSPAPLPSWRWWRSSNRPDSHRFRRNAEAPRRSRQLP